MSVVEVQLEHYRIVTVANIDDPSAELNLLVGTIAGDMIWVHEESATLDDPFTLYTWDPEATSVSENVPYTVDGSAGRWIACAGKYSNYYRTASTYQLFGPDATEGTIKVINYDTGTYKVQKYTSGAWVDLISADGDYLDVGGQRIVGSPDIVELAISMGPMYYLTTDDYIELKSSDDINPGVNDFSYYNPCVIFDNITATEYIFNKEASGVGFGLYKVGNDLYLRLDDGTTDVSGVILNNCIVAGQVNAIGLTCDRDGYATVYLKNASGDIFTGQIDISSASLTLSNAGNLRHGSDCAGANFMSGILGGDWGMQNRCMTADEMMQYLNGVRLYRYADASSTPIYESDFSADVDSWVSTRTTTSGDNDAISDGTTSCDDVLKTYASVDVGAHYIYRTISFEEEKNHKISLLCYVPSANTNVTKLKIETTTPAGTKLDELGYMATQGEWTLFEYEGVISTNATRVRIVLYKGSSESYAGAGSSSDDIAYVYNISCLNSGNVADFNPQGIGTNGWVGTVGGETVMATKSGATPFNLPPNHQDTDKTGTFTTDIASGTANKDINVPAGYEFESITVVNSLSSGDLTNVQAVLDPAGDNVTLFSGKTVSNGKTYTFKTLADHPVNSTAKTVRFNATGNGAGGTEIITKFQKANT